MILVCAFATSAAFAEDDPEIKNKDPFGINTVPRAAQGTGVEPQIGTMIDPDIHFHDHDNRYVKIGDYFGDKPLMLSFNYSNCPKLCSVQLENMTLAFREIDFEVGTDFQLISVSIDPLEQYSRAKESKDKFVRLYNRPASADSWHFLTGKNDEIEVLADNCGVRYKYVKRQKLYSHPPVFLLLSPKGKIVRYIYGLDYKPVTIERALVESAEGKIGSPINRLTFITGCFLYDESSGQYNAQAMGIMRIGGALTIFGLLIGLVPYWFFRRGKSTNQSGDEPANAEPVVQP